MLLVPRHVLEEIYRHAREGAPEEVCGLLAGRTEAGARRAVVAALPVRNAHPRPRSEYLLDPLEQLRVTLHVEEELGLELLGAYHSHPEGPAALSATDEARATWPGASYLVVHLRPREGHLSARWDDERRRFVEENVQVV